MDGDTAVTSEEVGRLLSAAYEQLSTERFLAREVNREIVRHLKRGPRTVKDLERLTGMSQPDVSSALRLLRLRGVVDFERRGQCCWYFRVGEK